MSISSGTSNRRQAIIEQAAALFARHGYAGTSIRLIAGACDITEAAIYRHFESKLNLYEEVIRHKAAAHDISGYLAEQKHRGSVYDVLVAISSHIITLTQADPDLMRLMFNNSLESGGVATALFQEIRLPYVEFLRQELVQRMESGEIITVDPLLTSRCFVGLVMDCALNLGIWETLRPGGHKPVDIYLNSSRIIARGLIAQPQVAALGAIPFPGRNP